MNSIIRSIDGVKNEESIDWLFHGSQQHATGDIPLEKALEVFKKLDQNKEPGIGFIENRVSPFVSGGTCSAMSLEFADCYFQLKNEFKKQELLDNIKKLESKFKTSSEEMRIRQSAYNTIAVEPKASVDVTRNKIQSLLNFHDFKIDYASDEINYDPQNVKNIKKEIKKLPNGVYIFRMLKPLINIKMEDFGHSTIYIKENGISLLYDPNKGAQNLTNKAASSAVVELFQECVAHYNTTLGRFYRFQKAIPSELPQKPEHTELPTLPVSDLLMLTN